MQWWSVVDTLNLFFFWALQSIQAHHSDSKWANLGYFTSINVSIFSPILYLECWEQPRASGINKSHCWFSCIVNPPDLGNLQYITCILIIYIYNIYNTHIYIYIYIHGGIVHFYFGGPWSRKSFQDKLLVDEFLSISSRLSRRDRRSPQDMVAWTCPRQSKRSRVRVPSYLKPPCRPLAVVGCDIPGKHRGSIEGPWRPPFLGRMVFTCFYYALPGNIW
jgi:hypothetical protein